MCDHYTKPDLFEQSDILIETYIVKAQTRLEQSNRIRVVDAPIEDSRDYDLVCEVANEMWLADILTDR